MAVKSGWWTKPKGRSGKAPYELSTGKSVIILGVIVACFAILWPKIFYPMIEVALRSPKPRSADNLAMVHPRVRQHVMRDMRYQKQGSVNQPFIGASSRSTIGQMKSKESGGIFNLLMPFYTIGLFVVFLYTILKFMSKDDDRFDDRFDDPDEIDEDSIENDKPIVKDFQMDPDYRKFVFSEEYDEHGDNIKRKVNSQRLKKRVRNDKQSAAKNTVQESIDLKKDEQICELKKRLQVTEDAMERILKQIGSLSQMLEAKGLLMSEISNLTGYKETEEIYHSEDEINTKLDKNGDDDHLTSGDSVYSSENQYKSSTDYDSDTSLSTTSSKFELEE
ncbi:resistance to inhibitors of cholinesterase protein 3 isoform X2 [Tetranychus urticae]|uniref:Resistance to inhibitors of cholinesterase protein 3 N-terminal domain-containing protein n=1 Tax=Tetranychus urticae TaxID=32264 RepID=T1KWP7_TETUR|nr:resistance to inhibitors of cholinesterase protein 3 isoform X2 [Tetranychus urticae]